VAELLGKSSGMFVPSGTMSNLIAVMTHCNERSSEMFVGDKAHIFLYEQGGSSYVRFLQYFLLSIIVGYYKI
jgi:threonine aldolase